MYSQYLKVKSTKSGNIVVSTTEIPANVPVLQFGGNVLKESTPPTDPNVLQIGTNLYLSSSGGIEDSITHSCDPTCKVVCLGERAILYSLYVIKIGYPITFDYSTTSTEGNNTFQMNCNCGSFKCRKVISGINSLSPQQIENYTSKGMLSLFMTDPRFK